MMTFIRPRLRKPLRNALAGTVFAAAWALHGGNAWQLSVVAEVTVLVSAITMYVRAGEDNDEGALAGSAPTSARSCSACGRGPWAGISPRSLPKLIVRQRCPSRRDRAW
jgi:hypothetical protein